jgi:16S rRNA (guanine966-N2)-methyltransferase
VTRIVGGVAGGRQIKTPSQRTTRPTSDRVREALFASIESSEGPLAGLRFLDVYAGSGAVGLEARSRGASAVTLVEFDRSIASLISANASVLRLDALTVLCTRAERLVQQPRPTAGFDVAFLDPPYDLASDRLVRVVADLRDAGWLAPDALVVVERSSRDPDWVWPARITALRERRYGETTLWYGRNNDGMDGVASAAKTLEEHDADGSDRMKGRVS